MPTLFGYRVEPDFNLAKEQRRDRLKVVLVGGFVLSTVYLFSGRPHPTEVFQALVATGLFYGENFYVRRLNYLSKFWLWKAILATIPLHILYLSGLFWSDRAFPEVMTKAIIFMPVIAVGFVIESFLVQRIIDRFRLSSIKQAGASETRS